MSDKFGEGFQKLTGLISEAAKWVISSNNLEYRNTLFR